MLGDQDRITSIADAQALAAGIQGARLAVVADAGHMVPLEQPERTTALLQGWLQL